MFRSLRVLLVAVLIVSPLAHGASAPESCEALLTRLAETLKTNPAEARQLEQQAFRYIAQLNATGELKPLLLKLGTQALSEGKLPKNVTQENLPLMVDRLALMIDAQLSSYGMTPTTKGTVYKPWDALAREQLKEIENKSLEELAAAEFLPADEVLAFVNGPASFARRDQLLAQAKNSIYIASWAFENDVTGKKYAEVLANRALDGIDVRVLVDHDTAMLPGYKEIPEQLLAAGVKLLRVRGKLRPAYGLHKKFIVIDGSLLEGGEFLGGGMNFGDVYSHLGSAETPKWRDTDIYVRGQAVQAATESFAKMWNEHTTYNDPIEESMFSLSTRGAHSSAMMIDHNPNPAGHDRIYLSLLKLISQAQRSLDITNAYYIATPALQKALLDAKKRGVRIRLFTNSAASVDEPIVSVPIQNSLPVLIEAGIEVYLKQGDTLHAKELLVDGRLAMVKSYNLHPQSLRFKGEFAVVTDDPGVIASLTRAREADLAAAKRVKTADEVRLPESTLNLFIRRYLFDQL